MFDQVKEIRIDSLSGGNGDIWMRLAGFYSISALVPEYKIRILVPSFLRKLAHLTFGSRLGLVEESNFSGKRLIYTNLGIRDLLLKIIKGQRFISPYQKAVVHDKRKRNLKDLLNLTLFDTCNYMGWVQIPAWRFITSYQGYLEINGIKEFQHISYEAFVSQLESDFDEIYSKLNSEIPISEELMIPEDIQENVLVFPAGTSRQFIPVTWAERHLPEAYYAFFYKDKEADLFNKKGLKTILFYKEPGDIIYLSRKAKWTISTDSFPSHLLQYSSKRCTITITEVLKSRIISPVFKGSVVDSEVACHPCLHLDRKNHPYCMAGFKVCKNWEDPNYTRNVLNSILDS